MPIELDRTASTPLYRQVAESLRRAIDDGRLRPGHRVPSVRALSHQLGVGRLTVQTAYEQLAADGYVVGRIGFGTVVAPDPPVRATTSDPVLRSIAGGRSGATSPARSAARDRARVLAATQPDRSSGRADRPRFDLRSSAAAGWSGAVGEGGLAVGAALERLLREEFRLVADRRDGGEIADPAGDARLRSAIAAHLRASRAARCDPEQVVILSGGVIAFGVIGRLWLGAGRRVAVEDPGDPQARRALVAAGARPIPVPVDGHGLRADLLPAHADAVVAASAVSVPSGSTMPLARRLRLLAWASSRNALVVEDGRFEDLLLRLAPQPCLQGIDDGDRVIHVGSFETLLHSGVRIAYAVLPSALVKPFVAELGAFDPGASPVQQRALGRFLADGLLDRHLWRVRRSLLERQEAALAALETEVGWLLDARPTSGGTRFVASVEDPDWTAEDVVGAAASAGVALAAIGPERLGPGPNRELLVDYGRLEPLELRAAFRAVGKAVRAGGPYRRARRVVGRDEVAAPA